MEYRKIHELRNWDKNPRKIDRPELDRLKKQLQDLGQYKPLIITKENIVIGGNMRLVAMKELGFEKAWVNVVEAETDDRKLEYALSDNDNAGETIKRKLEDLIKDAEIDLKEYRTHFGKGKSLDELIGEKEGEKPEIEFTQELMESHNYVVLYFDNDIDWLHFQTLYPLSTVQALNSRPGFAKMGVGRVIKGVDFLKTLSG